MLFKVHIIMLHLIQLFVMLVILIKQCELVADVIVAVVAVVAADVHAHALVIVDVAVIVDVTALVIVHLLLLLQLLRNNLLF